MRLTLHRAPDPALRAALFTAIDAYNDVASARPEPVIHLSIVLRDAAGAVEGGLIGIACYDWLIVDMLHVPDHRRAQGLGRRLMRAAEAMAARHGLRGIWLDTTSPAARAFYERLGFSVFATLPDQPLGHARWWLARRDPRPSDDSGLEIHLARHPPAAAVIGQALSAVGDALLGPDPRGETLAITAEDENGQQGGLWMIARRGWLFLDLFILHAAARRGGTGARILAMAEDAARARFCRGVWLDTFGFQAPGFYRRHGYDIFGELPDHPIGHGRFFLRKTC